MFEEPFRIIHSPRRKHLKLHFSADGILEVFAPLGVSPENVRTLLKKHRKIIERLRKKTPQVPPLSFSEGTHFWLLGKQYPLHLTRRLKIFDNSFMVPGGDEEQIKKGLVSLYRELAGTIISKRLPELTDAAGIAPQKIRISSADTRWGSCSSRRTLSFSWKLIQCPLELVDYVIVHELSHLKEMNHSPAFWKNVESILPDYRERKKQLNLWTIQLPHWD